MHSELIYCVTSLDAFISGIQDGFFLEGHDQGGQGREGNTYQKAGDKDNKGQHFYTRSLCTKIIIEGQNIDDN